MSKFQSIDDSSIQIESVSYSCPYCGLDEHVTTEQKEESFQYGVPIDNKRNDVNLSIIVPFHKCGKCNKEWITFEAEEIKHDRVCEYLGVLNPKQIKEIRTNLKMSYKEFADLCGAYESEIMNAERGSKIQSTMLDNLIFLLSKSENVKLLQERNLPIENKNV